MSWWEMNRKSILLYLCLGLFIGAISDRWILSMKPAPQLVQVKAEDKFATGVVGAGFYKDGQIYRVVLSDGRNVVADAFRETPTGWQAKVGDLWYRGEQ
jgi:hypothetical protein